MAAAFLFATPNSRGQALRDSISRESSVCASCHANIWQTYRRTGMARSFYRPAPDNTVEDYASKNTYYHQASGIHYEMIHLPASGGRADLYLQRQSTIDFDGMQSNVLENEIDFVMGSGNHARTYLHWTAQGTLEQLPLGWYAENGGFWAMNPGYDRADHQGFQRNVTYDCMFCHNGYPEIPAGTGPRSAPIFLKTPEGIDCQRCHGDGAKHVALARQGARADEIRGAILNPSRLTPERQMEVCAQCHLETTSSPLPASMVRYERGPFSYQPGEPLADFILHFDHAPGAGRDDKFEISGSVYRLRQSECFRKSNGALTCTTCHNPHEVLRGGEAARHYTSACRSCHAATIDRLVAVGAHTKSNDCIGCHMPKRRTEDVVHAVMTDHYIQRRTPAGDLLAARAEPRVDASVYRGEVVRYDNPRQQKPEDQLYLAIAQVVEQSNLTAGIARLQAAIDKYRPARAEYYLQLGDALSNAGKFTEAFRRYREALLLEPKSPGALERLALCFSALRQTSNAESALKEALEITPDSATRWVLLGGVRAQAGNAPAALAAFAKAIELDPQMPEAYNAAGAIWFETGDVPRAETALRRAILLQPNFAPAHSNLGNLLSASNRFEEARYHFEAALRLKENYNGARYNYALALIKVHRADEAQAQVEAILRDDPASAGAHELLGNLLVAKGQRARAIEQYREAVRIEPDFARADLEMGAALADSGDLAGAIEHLQKAAQSGTDGAAREEARKLLEKLKKAP
jgi:tetratricopeptide (TPR) repeat protein